MTRNEAFFAACPVAREVLRPALRFVCDDLARKHGRARRAAAPAGEDWTSWPGAGNTSPTISPALPRTSTAGSPSSSTPCGASAARG